MAVHLVGAVVGRGRIRRRRIKNAARQVGSAFLLALFVLIHSDLERSAAQICPDHDYYLETQAHVNSFPSCSSVSGDLMIGNTGMGATITIENLAGLSSLSSVAGDVAIVGIPKLTDLAGLTDMTSIGSLLISGNPALRNLDGLANLSTVESYIVISDNRFLTNVDGLSGLQSYGNSGSPTGLRVINNRSLTMVLLK